MGTHRSRSAMSLCAFAQFLTARDERPERRCRGDQASLLCREKCARAEGLAAPARCSQRHHHNLHCRPHEVQRRRRRQNSGGRVATSDAREQHRQKVVPRPVAGGQGDKDGPLKICLPLPVGGSNFSTKGFSTHSSIKTSNHPFFFFIENKDKEQAQEGLSSRATCSSRSTVASVWRIRGRPTSSRSHGSVPLGSVH